MSHYEHITRAAHRALGAAADYKWDESSWSLYIGDRDMPDVSFAPLRQPADAFELEAVLRLDVTYERSDKHMQVAVRCPHKAGNMTYMTILPHDAQKEDALAERMRAVTQFAAIMDDLNLAGY
jgi:hypothetical protein